MKNQNKELFNARHEQFMLFGTLVTFLAPAGEAAQQYTAFENIVPPLAGPPPHTHPEQEVFYVIAGNFEFRMHDLSKPILTTAGDVIIVPPNVLHTFKNTDDTMAKLLTILTKGKLEDYFRTIGTKVTTENDLPNFNEAPDFSTFNIKDALDLAPHYAVTYQLPEPVAMS